MKKKFVAFLTAVLMSATVGAFVGCTDKEDGSSQSSSQSEQSETFAELEDFTLGFGESRTLIATGENLVWQSSNTAVATVSQNGEVFALALGETTVTVTDGVQTASCKVTVVQSSNVPSCALDLSQRTVAVGKTHTLAPTVSVSGVALNGVAFTYESANTAIATVNENGVITAVAFGETNILVSYSAGGYTDTVEVPVKVVEDIVFEVSQTSLTLAVVEVDEGLYSSQAEIEVTQLLLNDTAVDVAEVRFSAADQTVATVANGVVTAKKVGQTVITATYQTQNSTVTIDVPVSVVRERKTITEKGSIDASWDATKVTPASFAYIKLPISLQLTDEEVLSVSDKTGETLSEGGLKIPKSQLTAAEKTVSIVTETLVYEVTVEVDNSFIQITDYGNQFDNAIGVKATALGAELDGRTDVVKAVSSTSGAGGVWYNHNGYLRFNAYAKSWNRGVFVYEVKADEGTPLGGYYANGTSSHMTDFALDTATKKFNKTNVKIVDANFEETTFTYGAWNTVVIDFTKIGTESLNPYVLFSFTNKDVATQYTAYYSNLRYMTKDLYEKLANADYETKYTVRFETGYDELVFTDQELSYRGRVEVPEIDDAYEFIGWMLDGTLVDLAKLYVTENITVTAVYDKNYQYTVKHFQRQINGAYKLVDTEVFEDKMMAAVSATPKTYQGYTYNADLSVASGYVEAYDKLVLACYYENDTYTFQNQAVGGHTNLTITQTAMENVPVEELRGNTYLYKKSTADGNTMNSFTYAASDLGKYLVLNVYYTKIPTQMGVVVWSNTAGIPTAGATIKGYYNEQGKLMESASEALNNWTSIVIYLDATKFLPDKTSFYLSLCSWSANELYYGEYAILTETEFKGFFEYTETASLPTGVTGYKGSSLTVAHANCANCLTGSFNGRQTFVSKAQYHFSSCGLKINGVNSWTAEQYVAVRVLSDSITGKHLLDSAYIGTQVVVYDDNGNEVAASAIAANTWYTYVYKTTATTIGQYSGCFLVNVAYEEGVKVVFDSIYVMENQTAYEAFKTWKGFGA